MIPAMPRPPEGVLPVTNGHSASNVALTRTVRQQISVVIPVHNESGNLKGLFQDLTRVMQELNVSYEIIFVDDGSQDDSLKILLGLQAGNPRVTVIELARNFGQHPAILAGFGWARGETIVTLDADGQNPPEAIPLLLEKMKEGFDMVGGKREERKDPWARKLASWMVNRFMSRAAGVKLTDYGCMLRAYRRDVVERILACKEVSTFIPALASTLSRRVAEIDVPHRARQNGASSYRLFKLLRLNFDFMTGFSILPIQLISAMGLLIAMAGLAFALGLFIWSVVLKLGGSGPINFRFSLTIFFHGLQLLALGIIGEYIGRIYNEVRNRPSYLVRQIHEPSPKTPC